MIDVTGWGGKTKTYDIAIDQRKLIGYGLSVPQVCRRSATPTSTSAARRSNFGAQSAVVRGVGLIHSADEIRHTLITSNQGAPVVIGDVASVTIGNLPRLGIAGYNDVDDIVQGIVLMRRGAQSMPTIKRVEAEVDKVNKQRHSAAGGQHPAHLRPQRSDPHHDPHRAAQHGRRHRADFPAAMGVPRQYPQRRDRRDDHSVRAVVRHRPHGAARRIGESLSVGAIDFGLVVDATVIMVENIFRHLAEASAHLGHGPSTLHRMRVRSGFRGKTGIISVAAAEVSQSIFFAAAIIIAGFVPLFTLSGIEGHIFGPDGEDLCLCHRGRPDRHLHHRTGLEPDAVPRTRSRSARRRRAMAAAHLRADARVRAGQSHHHFLGPWR